MKDIIAEAEVYSRTVQQEVPDCNRKIVYNAYIDGFNNAFASSEDVISHFVDRLHEIWFSIEKDTTLVKFIEMFYGVHLGEML